GTSFSSLKYFLINDGGSTDTVSEGYKNIVLRDIFFAEIIFTYCSCISVIFQIKLVFGKTLFQFWDDLYTVYFRDGRNFDQGTTIAGDESGHPNSYFFNGREFL